MFFLLLSKLYCSEEGSGHVIVKGRIFSKTETNDRRACSCVYTTLGVCIQRPVHTYLLVHMDAHGHGKFYMTLTFTAICMEKI